MNVTAYDVGQRFVGVKEIAGTASNPMILSMLRLDADWPAGDEVPWCSAFVNLVTWLLRLPRSKSLSARSWLAIGAAVDLAAARVGYDVVILKRGIEGPGPDVLQAPGHVGFYGGRDVENRILVLGGNQDDRVSLAPFSATKLLGVRRLL